MTPWSNFFDVVLFVLSSLITGPSFMSVSSLVLALWQFSFIRYWPKIRKSEIPPPEFCLISRDWGELWISNLAQMSLTECYWMLRFWVFKGKSTGGVNLPPHPTQIRVKGIVQYYFTDNITIFLRDITTLMVPKWFWDHVRMQR